MDDEEHVPRRDKASGVAEARHHKANGEADDISSEKHKIMPMLSLKILKFTLAPVNSSSSILIPFDASHLTSQNLDLII